MKKINSLTYLNALEIYNTLQEDKESKDVFKREEIEKFLDEGKIRGKRIDGQWHASLCDVVFFFNSCTNQEVYNKQEYGGGIGVDLSNTRLDGRILDIGGGGEGIIGQLKGDWVVAIDPSRQELKDTPDSGLKVEMDAKDLKFLDNSFATVTSFFTLMYIPNSDHRRVFEEIHRVLKHKGEFILWDIDIPEYTGNQKTVYIVFLEVTIPGKTIHTGYGTKWDGKQQSMKYFMDLGESVGFKIFEAHNMNQQGYMIRFIKD